LFKNAVKLLKEEKNTPKARMFNLNGTSCMYRKAIAPFARYGISSQILCWDQKWIYVVSHFAKPGSNKLTKLVLGLKEERAASENSKDGIYAMAMTKYVPSRATSPAFPSLSCKTVACCL
jgi:hypothetical protein